MDRIIPGSGQESVWDYPRPPRAETCCKSLTIVFADQVLVETTQSIRVLETSHPPVYYIPLEIFEPGVLLPTDRQTLCEWKGVARYYHVMVDDFAAEYAAWSYCKPTPVFELLRDHVAFYAHAMDSCRVDGERVHAQLGGFYGDWVTKDIAGPFKGTPGTDDW
jgi:uncharacterized protein (DUF427 family)